MERRAALIGRHWPPILGVVRTTWSSSRTRALSCVWLLLLLSRLHAACLTIQRRRNCLEVKIRHADGLDHIVYSAPRQQRRRPRPPSRHHQSLHSLDLSGRPSEWQRRGQRLAASTSSSSTVLLLHRRRVAWQLLARRAARPRRHYRASSPEAALRPPTWPPQMQCAAPTTEAAQAIKASSQSLH